MNRRRQVRFRYPPAMRELASLLATRHAKRDVARALALPLATLYRWTEGCSSEPARLDLARLAQLVCRCEQGGFRVRNTVELLIATSLPAVHSVAPQERRRRRAEFPASQEDGPCAACDEKMLAALQGAHRELTRRYYEKWSSSKLAQLSSISKWYFIRTFRQAYGTTPHKLLTATRLKHACRLLERTPHSLESVAIAVGFDSESALRKAFRSMNGFSLSALSDGVRLSAAPRLAAA